MGSESGNKAIFPEYLVKWLMDKFAAPGDIIMDPFMGSGTTAYVARKYKCNFIGFEIQKDYIQFAEDRLKTISAVSMENFW
jgi:DNA modification methylase